MTRALLYAKATAHGLACMALHALGNAWPGQVGLELRKLADQHSDRAKLYRAMWRREAQ